MCHVLIIEDEPVFALNLAQLLLENGASSYDIAETEEEAVKYATINSPEFISSDVRLKHGTGTGAVQSIFNLLGKIPVIFVTASPELIEPHTFPSRVMTKPLDESHYCKLFRELVGQ